MAFRSTDPVPRSSRGAGPWSGSALRTTTGSARLGQTVARTRFPSGVSGSTTLSGSARRVIRGRRENLERDPSVVIHLESGDETVILEGEIDEVEAQDELERFADIYEA